MKDNDNDSPESGNPPKNPIDSFATSVKDNLVDRFKVIYESQVYYICVIGITVLSGIWSLFSITQDDDNSYAIGMSAILLLPSAYTLYTLFKDGFSKHHWKIYYSLVSFIILIYLVVQLVYFLFFLAIAILILIAIGSNPEILSSGGDSNGKDTPIFGTKAYKERAITKVCKYCNYCETRPANAFSSMKCPSCGKYGMITQ